MLLYKIHNSNSFTESSSDPDSSKNVMSKISLKLSSFAIQAVLMWILLGIPGNVGTIYLLNQNTVEEKVSENNSTLHCHELKKDWEKTIEMSQYFIQGLSILIIGIFGFAANLLSVYVLLQVRENRNFHRLLAGLTSVDTILILILVVEMSILGVFMKKEPHWYIVLYPSLIHPGRGIVQTAAIFMVVAVSTERYR